MAVREGSCRNNNEKPAKRVRVARHCGRYGKKGHNSCTCIAEIKNIDNSDTSKE